MFRLALPVVLSNLGMMTMALIDLVSVGHVSAEALGSVGLGHSLFSWVMVFGIGLLTGLDYLVSLAHGAGQSERGFRALIQGLMISVALAIPLTAGLIFLSFHLSWLGVNPEILGMASRYLRILSFSLLPALIFTSCRQYLQALGIATPALVVMILANVLNASTNYAVVLGHFGFPRMGAIGAAWGTLLARTAMMVALGAYLIFRDRKLERLIGRVPFRLDRSVMRQLLQLGFPSAMQMVLEVGVFATATTLAARLTADALAAHQIVLNVASLTFMVPLGVGSATAVLVGQSLGRGDSGEAVSTGWRGFQLGVGFMAISCLVFLLFPEAILGCYTHDPGVIRLGRSVLVLAALFQLADGTQVVGTGALRGIGDTRTPMIANLCGHWLVGLPLGVWLCFHEGYGLLGLWVGLAVGLILVAASLLWRWRASTRGLLQGAALSAPA